MSATRQLGTHLAQPAEEQRERRLQRRRERERFRRASETAKQREDRLSRRRIRDRARRAAQTVDQGQQLSIFSVDVIASPLREKPGYANRERHYQLWQNSSNKDTLQPERDQ